MNLTNQNDEATQEIHPKDSVYPLQAVYGDGSRVTAYGINVRAHFASIAMQSFIAADPDRKIAYTAKDAVEAADALIEALNKGGE